MKQDERAFLDRATRALHADLPDDQEINAAAARTAKALGIDMQIETETSAIRSCHDVQQLLNPYRAGSLPEARALLVRAHLQDCGVCLRRFHEDSALEWSTPRIASTPHLHNQAWAWGLAVSCALLICAFFVYRVYWQVPPGVRAEVQSIDGSAYLISGNQSRQLVPGAVLYEGDELRTTGGSHAVLRLADGSVVEVDQRSTLGVAARGRNSTIALDQGALIVQAAHRRTGHLYLNARDCRIAVTGTVFSVNSGIKGSRVAVLRGSVDVAHSGTHTVLHPGDQVATSDSLAPEPLAALFAWSSDRQEYIGIMAQLANVEHRIAQIPFPQSRYSSDLLARVPADTLLYISIPNLGDYISQANGIFQEQLNQSTELQQWWAHGHKQSPADLNALVEKIHDVTQYLGDEIIIVAGGEGDHRSVAALAEVQRGGLAAELQQQFSNGNVGLVVLDETALAAANPSDVTRTVYALVRPHEVVFSNSIATLKQLNAQLDAGASGFATSDFGKQISAAYDRGAGIILAANVKAMMQNPGSRSLQAAAKERAIENSGLAALQYLIAEHREANGTPENHVNLQFAGTRQRVASWLAGPAPIGSLDFVSPNAAVAVAALSKDPASIADDILAMASDSQGTNVNFNEIDAKLGINVRDDLMANLGGDFLFALDGPVLPTPSWKLVIEVNNADRLESTLERLAQAISSEVKTNGNAHAIAIDSSTVGSQRYYAIRDVTTGMVKANYTFSNGFMIVAPTRALLMDTLQIQSSGNSLARSTSFRALLPHDQNENYSAVAYQNLSPVLTPLLSQFSGETADALRKLAADSRPTVICAWGKDSGIEAASDSRLFGFDFLTLGAILNSGNKSAGQLVSR